MKNVWMALIASTAVLLTSPVFAHGKLLTSNPKEGASLDKAPTEVRLQFDEAVEAIFSTIKLIGPAGKEMATDKAHVDKDDAKTVILNLPSLAAGVYKAEWSMVGPDGHRVKGEVRFSVR